jgi:hypothetical protein
LILPLLAISLLAQSVPAPAAPVKVTVITEARGATLTERVSKKVVCSAPCGQLLTAKTGAEFVLRGEGAIDSDPFTLGTAPEVNVRWVPASMVSRVFGVALTVTGFVAVLSAIAVGLSAMVLGIACSNSAAGCGDLRWAYSAIGHAGGGYAVLGVGMTLMFRFGMEGLAVEAVPPPPPRAALEIPPDL